MNENTQLIVVKQLPIIEERLRQVSAEVDRRVEEAKSLVCTEDTVKSVKKTRSELNKQFKELEEQRKAVKTAVLAPYNNFEIVYKECVSDKFRAADANLKGKVDDVENRLKDERRKEIEAYFIELCQFYGLDFVKWEQAEINVTLSASKKSLKGKAKAFVEKVVDELSIIATQKYADEVLAEYKPTLNLSGAINHVNEVHRCMEEEERKRAERADIQARSQASTAKVDEIVPPAVVTPPVEITPHEEDQEQVYKLTFTVRGTKAKLKELKKFLINGGYDYE